MIVDVELIDAVAVAVHVRVNPTVIVICPVDGQNRLHPCNDSLAKHVRHLDGSQSRKSELSTKIIHGSDHDHGIVQVHVHGHDHDVDHDNVC